MRIKEILEVTNGKLLCGDENFECENFSKDTRTINQGDTYIALKGESFDGNDYYKQAFENGAEVCIMSKEPEDKIKNIIIVEDTLKALQQLAEYKRKINPIPVVAITGSVGKTSTKDLIASVLSTQFKVLKTEGNQNNDIGLPLTILRLKDEEILVTEMGMNHFGEISLLSKIAKPNLAVITNVGTAHIGNLGSRENILKAKLEILDGLQGNTIIVNNDNDLLNKWAKEEHGYNVITFGAKEVDSKYLAKNIKLYEDRSEFDIDGNKVTVPVAGEHFVLNALSAIAVGEYFNIPINKIIEGIAKLDLTKKRMEILKAKCGAIIINDTYNANYDSMKAALEYLQGLEGRRKIAILGDMLELGEYSEQIHTDIGRVINNVDILITVGKEARNIQKYAKAKEMLAFDTNEEVISKIKNIMQENDAILLKASNSMKLSEITDSIIK